MTYGEKAVGLSFNPSSDPVVQKIKELYAQIIDTIKGSQTGGKMYGELYQMILVAIREAQTAQMWAVKVATWKY